MIDLCNLQGPEWVHLCTLVGIPEDDWTDAWLHLKSLGDAHTEVDAIAALGVWRDRPKTYDPGSWMCEQSS
jgi:hypothetical protein